MKNLRFLMYFVSIIATIMLQSCIYRIDDSPSRYSSYEPVYMSRQQLENSIKMSPARSMVKAGKIYVKDSYIFITDENKGFHIYNNSNPNAPQLIGFLEVPGATDMAIKNNTIYINQAVDLVAVTVNNTSVTVNKRIPNTFPQKISPDGLGHNSGTNEIIVDWKKS